MTLYEELEWRGLIKDFSDPSLVDKLNNDHLTFYIGTDPTGDSLHIGHLSSFLICNRLANHGHKPIILIGGATGLIGDPKPESERPMISKEEVLNNCDALTKQINQLFNFEVVNNYDWLKDISFIDYLREYGKHFPIGYILNKDIVKRRLDEGITYTEFSYTIMQAVDFLWLYENKNCTLQVAGQDQWGNITSGIELIRKKINGSAYAFTMPLVLKSDGTKFGKTSSGDGVWLSKDKTSVYDFYQFFLNTEDNEVINRLKRFTFLNKEEIDALEVELNNQPELRKAQKALAFEITKFVHGEDEAFKVKETSEEIFNNGGISSNMPTIEIDSKIIKDNINVIDLLVLINLVPSKSEGRRLIEQGGLLINSEKVTDFNLIIDESFLSDDYLIIQKGKKTYLKVACK